MKEPKVLAGLAVVGLALAACGGGGGGTTASGTCTGEIKIGVDLPESGNEASNGLPTLNGVKFAVQNKWGGKLEGCTLTVENLDDAVNGVHNPQKGAQNVQTFVSDTAVLGMVGPFNSSVAKAEIPITNAAHLTQISPANTNPCLTKDLASCSGLAKQLRPSGPNNYFRVAATDDLQGPAMADYAYDKLGLKSLGVASDNETYGKGIADTFAAEFQKKGGTVVKRQDFDIPTTNDFKPFLTSAKVAGAQGIYFGGTDSNKACVVRSQMSGIFAASVPELGGDGIVTTQCLKDAASNVVGMYGTVAAVDAKKQSAAASVIADFQKAFPNATDYGAYTMPAYDSANILITAIDNALKANGFKIPTREQVRAQVASTTNFPGVLGPTSFDANGDTSNKIITVYYSNGCCTDDNWAWKDQVAYAGA